MKCKWMAALAAALLMPAAAGAVSPAELADSTKYRPLYMTEAGTVYADLSSIRTGDPVEGQLPLIQADIYMESYQPSPDYDTVVSGKLVQYVFAYHTKLLAMHRTGEGSVPLQYYADNFTKRDIMDAMQFYQENYVTYSRSEAERVSAIPMPANKRNYQKQADHLEEARAIRDIRMKRQDRDWREGNGRPKGSGEKSKIVEEWQRQHPDGKKADCIRETGLSKPTVYKWWK